MVHAIIIHILISTQHDWLMVLGSVFPNLNNSTAVYVYKNYFAKLSELVKSTPVRSVGQYIMHFVLFISRTSSHPLIRYNVISQHINTRLS